MHASAIHRIEPKNTLKKILAANVLFASFELTLEMNLKNGKPIGDDYRTASDKLFCT